MSVWNEREACRRRVKFPGYQRVLAEARAVIEMALGESPNSYVAFSCGKDSSTVLHLVRGIAPNVPAIMGYDDWLIPETEELSQRTPNLYRIAATIYHSDEYSSWAKGKPDTLPDGVVWFDSIKNSRVAPYALQSGFNGAFIGLRKEEASYRRCHLNSRGLSFFCKTHGMFECNPIANWKVEDVWTYLLSNEVDYNKVYDVMTTLEIPLKHQRVGPILVERVAQYGQLEYVKRGWPGFYNSFVQAFPDARKYS